VPEVPGQALAVQVDACRELAVVGARLHGGEGVVARQRLDDVARERIVSATVEHEIAAII
jgi:hypothetical protein